MKCCSRMRSRQICRGCNPPESEVIETSLNCDPLSINRVLAQLSRRIVHDEPFVASRPTGQSCFPSIISPSTRRAVSSFPGPLLRMIDCGPAVGLRPLYPNQTERNTEAATLTCSAQKEDEWLEALMGLKHPGLQLISLKSVSTQHPLDCTTLDGLFVGLGFLLRARGVHRQDCSSKDRIVVHNQSLKLIKAGGASKS